ncbi:hypothetical protein IGJ55_000888 [Enterococcus sp. AZ170]|uniref:NUDIX hydrolase n=1 Tax=unclassified Enterococcus TaxID=2608891 RepID=UPI003D2953A9
MDCTFQTDAGRFNYRVGAIITSDLGLLVVSNSKEPYFYSVGGRVKLHETADEAIEREVFEETGKRIKQKKLGFFHENFFTSALTNERYHELCLYYYIELSDKLVSSSSRNEFGAQEQLLWLSLGELQDADIRPAFLKKITNEKKESVQHLIQKK